MHYFGFSLRGSGLIAEIMFGLLLLTAAAADWKKGKIYNFQIAAGIILEVIYFGISGQGMDENSSFITAGSGIALCLVRFTGTCAAFFPLFLCRMIGAGDIKLMALSVGFLGIWDGIAVLFLGLSFAAAVSAARMYRDGSFWQRLGSLARFAEEIGRKRGFQAYHEVYYERDVIHLGPYLAAGYGLFMLTKLV